MTGWWGPQYNFENIMDVASHPERRYNPMLTFHLHVMLYCVLLCDNDPLDLTLDEFLAALEDLDLTRTLTEYYTRRVEILSRRRSDKEPEGESKKKT